MKKKYDLQKIKEEIESKIEARKEIEDELLSKFIKYDKVPKRRVEAKRKGNPVTREYYENPNYDNTGYTKKPKYDLSDEEVKIRKNKISELEDERKKLVQLYKLAQKENDKIEFEEKYLIEGKNEKRTEKMSNDSTDNNYGKVQLSCKKIFVNMGIGFDERTLDSDLCKEVADLLIAEGVSKGYKDERSKVNSIRKIYRDICFIENQKMNLNS